MISLIIVGAVLIALGLERFEKHLDRQDGTGWRAPGGGRAFK